MLHADTLRAVARGAANEVSRHEVADVVKLLEDAARACDERAADCVRKLEILGPTHVGYAQLEPRKIGYLRTARELRTLIRELQSADKEANGHGS
jgi:hypothetical protein